LVAQPHLEAPAQKTIELGPGSVTNLGYIVTLDPFVTFTGEFKEKVTLAN
jgi:hypothetical protein